MEQGHHRLTCCAPWGAGLWGGGEPAFFSEAFFLLELPCLCSPTRSVRGQGRAGGEVGSGSRRGLTGWPGGLFLWGPGGDAEVGFAVPPALGHVSVLPSCSLMTGLCICSPAPRAQHELRTADQL